MYPRYFKIQLQQEKRRETTVSQGYLSLSWLWVVLSFSSDLSPEKPCHFCHCFSFLALNCPRGQCWVHIRCSDGGRAGLLGRPCSPGPGPLHLGSPTVQGRKFQAFPEICQLSARELVSTCVHPSQLFAATPCPRAHQRYDQGPCGWVEGGTSGFEHGFWHWLSHVTPEQTTLIPCPW